MQERQRKHSQADIAIIQKYGDGRKFAETFNPDLQRYCAENIDRSLTGNAPTVTSLKSAYSVEQVRVWILAQLENINQYVGTQNKMNPNQMVMLSDIILTEYHYLKASELLLFFFQFKAGKYGELYGSVDPLRISSALIAFASYRRGELFRIEADRKAEADKLFWEKKCSTASQYHRRKFKKSKKKWHRK